MGIPYRIVLLCICIQGIIEAKLWSILIPTIRERSEQFNFIYNKLKKNIIMLGLGGEIEIIYFLDNRGAHTVGFKRNTLLQQSTGKYVCFVDDDDDVSDNYIQIIYEKLQSDPDCVSLHGIVTFNGQNPKHFFHSIKYTSYFEHNNMYYRPPNHLNPIRRSIAILFKFPEINITEDTQWAMKIAYSGLLKKEAEINQEYYYYLAH